ncbi:hypothetical protein PC120_g2503 [Phytophthora cactorum]|nr:hypothetical protein PC120_g2503 [Phytophthora cactorum]
MLLWIKGSAAQRLVGHETRRLAESSDSYNFMFYFVIGAMMLTCLIYNIFFKHKMEANFLRQQALPETMLRQDVIASDQDMNNLWECEVCSFKSYDAHTTCMLCGTDRSFKMIEKTTRAIDESSSEHSNAPSSASSSTKYVLYMDEKENPLTRRAVNRATPSRSIGSKSTAKINREFFKRKLSVLNLRQQSARRRHEWSRQRNDDGELIWVRKKHYMDRKALKSLRNLDSLRSQSSASLRDSILSNGSVNSVGIVSRIVVSPKNPTGRLSLEAADGALATRGSDSSEFSQDELEQPASTISCTTKLSVDSSVEHFSKWLRDNTGVESLALDFTVNVDQMSDKAKVADLVPNGSNISVTDENKMDADECLYPRAHTCFNRIDLPRYDTEKDLRIALSLVIQMEVTGFTIE